MSRHKFGGMVADWAFSFNSDGSVSQAGGAVLTFWDSLSGGTQYTAAPLPGGVDDGTGLLDGTGVPVSSVTCDSNGEIPDALQGPDGVYRMAADASGAGTGPRRWLYANDIGADLTALLADVAAIPALEQAPVYVYYDTTLAAYPARPAVTAPVWWVGPVPPTIGGTGGAGPADVWLNTTGAVAPGGVTSVTAGDASITTGGTATAPSVETGTLDQIAGLHPPAAAWSNNGQKITGGAPGAAGTDFATVSQIAGTLVPTAVQTSGYTAAASDFVLVSAASGNVTITLPAAPADKTRIGVKMVAQAGSNTVTVARGGTDVFNAAGGVTSLVLTRVFQTVTAQYESSAGLWLVTGADLALTVDTTASDIKATSTAAAAGTSQKVPAADHVHVQDYGGIFGDGSDGAVTLDGTAAPAWASKVGSVYTLTRDVFCTNLTVNSGVTLIPAGFRIFCQGTFANAGTVSANGNNGNNGGAVASSTGSGTLGGGRSSGAGQTTAGSAGFNGSIAAGNAGNGGNGTGANTGGTGGVPQVTNTSALRAGPGYVLNGNFPFGGSNSVFQGGSSGGGGGGDGTNKGASGGGGGGIIAILAWSIVNTGTFTAAGGNGVAPSAGNCGGGGGGTGGLVIGYSLAAWTAGTITVAGGSGGAGIGTGTAGTAGSAGMSLNMVVQ